MTQNDFYFDTIIHAIHEIDVDVCDDPTLDDYRDAFHNYAHGETYAWFGDTNEVSLSEAQNDRIEKLLIEYFG